MNRHLFCFGFGYVAQSLSLKLPSNWRISGTHSQLSKEINDRYSFNQEAEFDLSVLDDVSHILISIPPTETGDLVYARCAEYISKLKNIKWIGYFSSTSVYGDHQGAWVEESSQTNPADNFGKNRLIAEKQWLSTSNPINILRVSGIYGPSRSIFDTIQASKANRIEKPNHFFSRIYIKDLVYIIEKMMVNPLSHEIFNLSDDLPAPQHEVVKHACDLMGIKPPKLVKIDKANLSPAMQSYYNSSKKVSNKKVKQVYNLKLNYPDYKFGLKDILVDI